jgi:hypothetical protein
MRYPRFPRDGSYGAVLVAIQRLGRGRFWTSRWKMEVVVLSPCFDCSLGYASPRLDAAVGPLFSSTRDEVGSRGPRRHHSSGLQHFTPPPFLEATAQSLITSSKTYASVHSLHDTQLEEPIATMVREDLITSAVSLERVLATDNRPVY